MRLLLILSALGCGRIGFDAGMVGGGPVDDAARGVDAAPCAPTCVAQGGTCGPAGCTFVPPPSQPIACPSSATCDVECTAANSCAGVAISCPVGATCIVHCEVAGSCSNLTLDCEGNCELFCDVPDTCIGNTITCNAPGCRLECCALTNVCNSNSCSGSQGCQIETAGCP